MSVRTVASKFVELCRQGKNFDAICDHNGAINMTQILTRAKVQHALQI